MGPLAAGPRESGTAGERDRGRAGAGGTGGGCGGRFVRQDSRIGWPAPCGGMERWRGDVGLSRALVSPSVSSALEGPGRRRRPASAAGEVGARRPPSPLEPRVRPWSGRVGWGGGRPAGTDFGAPLVARCAEAIEPAGAHPRSAEEAGRKKPKRGHVAQAVIDVMRENYYGLEGFHRELINAKADARAACEAEEAAVDEAEESRLELAWRVEHRGVTTDALADFLEAHAAREASGSFGTWLRPVPKRERLSVLGTSSPGGGGAFVAPRPRSASQGVPRARPGYRSPRDSARRAGSAGPIVHAMEAMQQALRRQAYAMEQAEHKVGSLLIKLNEELHLHEDTEQGLRSAIMEYDGMAHGSGWKSMPAPKLGRNHSTMSSLRMETARGVLSMCRASPYNSRVLSIAAKKGGKGGGMGDGAQGVNAGRDTSAGPPSQERSEAVLLARRMAFFVRERISVEMSRFATDTMQRRIREKRLVVDTGECWRFLAESAEAAASLGDFKGESDTVGVLGAMIAAREEDKLMAILENYESSVVAGQKRIEALLNDINGLRDLARKQASGHARLQAVLKHELDDFRSTHGDLKVLKAKTLQPARPFSAAGIRKAYLVEADRVHKVRLKGQNVVAAMQIQAAYRGHRSRQVLLHDINAELSQLAAHVLQRWWRARLMRKVVSSKELSVRIQTTKTGESRLNKESSRNGKAEDALEERAETQEEPENAPKDPAKAPKELVKASNELAEASKEAVGAPKKPVGAPKKPVGAPKRPVGAPKRPVGAPKKTAEESKEPVEASKELVEARNSLAEDLKARFKAKTRTVIAMNRIKQSIADGMSEVRSAAASQQSTSAGDPSKKSSPNTSPPRRAWQSSVRRAVNANRAMSLRSANEIKAGLTEKLAAMQRGDALPNADPQPAELVPQHGDKENALPVAPSQRKAWQSSVKQVINVNRLTAADHIKNIKEGLAAKLAAL